MGAGIMEAVNVVEESSEYCILWKNDDEHFQKWEQLCDEVDRLASAYASKGVYAIGYSSSFPQRQRGFCIFQVPVNVVVYDSLCNNLRLLANEFRKPLVLMKLHEGIVFSPNSQGEE